MAAKGMIKRLKTVFLVKILLVYTLAYARVYTGKILVTRMIFRGIPLESVA